MSNHDGTAFGQPESRHASAGLAARFLGVLFSPRNTFAGVVAEPRWAGMLVLTVLIGVACTSLFVSTETGRQALLDAQVNRMESFGMQVTDELYAHMEQRLSLVRYIVTLGTVVSVPLMALAAASTMFAVFSAVLGGDASFRQVFAVMTHVGAIAALQRAFVTPLNYVRESMDSATNLGLFLPMLDEGTFAARTLGAIDVFVIWQIVAMSVGLSVLYRRPAPPIAMWLLGFYGLSAMAVATIMNVLGGS